MRPTIVVTEVTKKFRSTRALEQVSFEAGPGVTGLLGPNGAGKTTLLRILATALAPDSGRIRVLEHDPSTAAGRLAIRRRLGYLPQETGHYRTFSAYDFVDYVAILKEMTATAHRRREVRRVLTTVGMADQMHKPMGTLSGGMRRRVALAQALLGDPDVLILDEPTAGLDPVQRLRFREVVSSSAQERCAVISTHLTEDVAALCSHVVVVDGGAVRFAGEPSALAQLAAGRVWLSSIRDPGAMLSWVTSDGLHRNIGEPPSTATLRTPTVEDGYLILTGRLEEDGPTEKVETLR